MCKLVEMPKTSSKAYNYRHFTYEYFTVLVAYDKETDEIISIIIKDKLDELSVTMSNDGQALIGFSNIAKFTTDEIPRIENRLDIVGRMVKKIKDAVDVSCMQCSHMWYKQDVAWDDEYCCICDIDNHYIGYADEAKKNHCNNFTRCEDDA